MLIILPSLLPQCAPLKVAVIAGPGPVPTLIMVSLIVMIQPAESFKVIV